MTLTAILPTLRRSLPEPLRLSAWPEYTSASTIDVVTAGVSMLRLAALCDTPCAHTADALVPGSHARPVLRRDASIVLVAVTDVFDSPTGRIALIDGDLTTVPAIWDQTRLIGRVSTEPSRPMTLLAAAEAMSAGEPGHALLPGDLAAGDLLAIPCPGIVVLHDIRPRTASHHAGSAAR